MGRAVHILGLVVWLGMACPPLVAGEEVAPSADQSEAKVIHTEEAQVGTIFVVEEDGLRSLRFDNPLGDDQSLIDPRDPDAVPMDYIQLALACLAHSDRVEQVLMIGLGAGTFTTAVYKALPAAQIDAVEISPEVVRVAHAWFGLPKDPRYRIHLAEGRAYLAKNAKRWDVIFLDAYTEVATPPELMRAQAVFAELRKRLRPGGVVLLNLAVPPEQERLALDALGRSFGQVTCYLTPDRENLLAVGRADGRRLTSVQISGRVGALSLAGRWPFDLGFALGEPVGCSDRRAISLPGKRPPGPPTGR